jgi:hypothetical protein
MSAAETSAPVALIAEDSRIQAKILENRLQQAGYTPVLVKVINQSTVTKRIWIVRPQAGPPYAGVAELSMKRQQQEGLRQNENVTAATDRFLHVEMFASPPMTDALSGLEVEYAIALIYSSEAGKREATIGFDVAQGNQDLGFRGEVPVLFDVRRARRVNRQAIEHEFGHQYWYGMVGSNDFAGNIGSNLLEQFVCTFDYERRKLYLEPGKRYGTAGHFSRAGSMFLRFRHRVVVAGILAGHAQANTRYRIPPRLRNCGSAFGAMGQAGALRQTALHSAYCFLHRRIDLFLYCPFLCPTCRHVFLQRSYRSISLQYACVKYRHAPGRSA